MAKHPAEFTEQNTHRAIQAATFGLNWYWEIAEQNLNQSRIAVEGLLRGVRKMADDFESQMSAISRHSISLTHEMLSNAFDLGHKLLRAKEPQELVQLQSDFVSRQAQSIADETRELGQTILNGTQALAATPIASDSHRAHAKAAA